VGLSGRVLTAMVSPFTAGGALDLDAARNLAAHLVDHGSDGIVVAGSTGESPTLTHQETLDLFRVVVETVGDRATVLAGTGKNDTAATIELSREAAAIGVDGLLLVAPYYNRPSQRGLVQHFGAVADAVGELPVVLYDIPSRTGVELSLDTILTLARDHANVVGLKDAAGNFPKSAAIVSQAPPGFQLFAGDDVSTLPLMALGAVGVISVAAHLVGEDLAALVDAFPTDPGKAREIHFKLLPLFEALFCDVNPVPLKAAMHLVGLPAGGVRAPLADADQSTIDRVRDALRAVGVSLHA
jgi:4-hydroxy-tetrahydrodipicolinate synthase